MPCRRCHRREPVPGRKLCRPCALRYLALLLREKLTADPCFAAERRARVDVMAVRARLRRPLFEESYLTVADIARLWARLAPGPWDANRSHAEELRRNAEARARRRRASAGSCAAKPP
jgi:hypothetical protein